MFTDVELSRQCQTQFSDHLAKQTTSNNSVPMTTTSGGGQKEEQEDQQETTTNTTMMMTSPSSSSSAVNRGGTTVKTEIAIQLLTTGYWPTFPTYPSLVIPAELQSLMTQFQQFYDSHFQGRRLTWAHALERCVVIGWFPKRKHELEVSFLQALVLRCFNTAERLSFQEIK
jgi:hypothetical protein